MSSKLKEVNMSEIIDALYKQAAENPNTDEKTPITAKNVAGVYIAGGGAALIPHSIPNIKNMNLSGRETLYHNTDKENVESIKDKGIMSSKANSPDTFTKSTLYDIDPSKLDDTVYLSRNKIWAESVGRERSYRKALKNGELDNPFQRDKAVRLHPNETLTAKVPLWKMKTVENPELRGAKTWQEYQKSIPDYNMSDFEAEKSFKHLGEGAVSIKGDVPPEYIVGSSKYKKVGVKDVADYARHRPKDFGKSIAPIFKPLLPAALIAGGVSLAASKPKNDDNKTASEIIDCLYKQANIFSKKDIEHVPDITGNIHLITGFSGSGKTTLGEKMEKESPNNTLIELDGFQHGYKINPALAGTGDATQKYDMSSGKGIVDSYILDNGLHTSDNPNASTSSILNYIEDVAKNHPDKKYIVEGVQLLNDQAGDFVDRYPMTMRGTGLIKSSLRRFLRKGNDEGLFEPLKYNLGLNKNVDEMRDHLSKQASRAWKSNFGSLSVEGVKRLEESGVLNRAKELSGLDLGNQKLINSLGVKIINAGNKKEKRKMVNDFVGDVTEKIKESKGVSVLSPLDSKISNITGKLIGGKEINKMNDYTTMHFSKAPTRIIVPPKESANSTYLGGKRSDNFVFGKKDFDKDEKAWIRTLAIRHELDEARSMNHFKNKNMELPSFYSHASPAVVARESQNTLVAPDNVKNHMSGYRNINERITDRVVNKMVRNPDRAEKIKNVLMSEGRHLDEAPALSNFGVTEYGKQYDISKSNLKKMEKKILKDGRVEEVKRGDKI